MLQNCLQALEIDGEWEWSPMKRVCSKHFVDTDFISVGPKTFLKRGAVPRLLYKSTSSTISDLRQKPSDCGRSEIEVVPSTSFNSSVSVATEPGELSTSTSDRSTKNKSRPKKLKVLKCKKR